jgi:histone-lysine N-methyltransferase SETMAR
MSMFIIFFSGEKLAFLDSLPGGQNMDSYYFRNTVLEGVKAGALAGTQNVTLRDFHIHMENCKVHNSRLTRGNLDEIRPTRWDHPIYSPDIAPSDFWFFGWSKKEMTGQAFSRREAVKTFLLQMWARMDSGQLFSIFDEWMKRLEYVIESGGEYYVQ